MKKLISLIGALAIALSVSTAALAKTPTVYVDGQKIEFDAQPFIENDRTLVPMRAIFEAMGANVAWDQTTLTVFALKPVTETENDIVTIQIGNPKAFVNSTEILLDVPAKVVSDRTFVPLRFIGESLNATVDWDPDTFNVTITSK